MKKHVITSILFVFVASISIAQNNTAYFDASVKGIEGDKTITIEFKVDNITDEAALNEMSSLFSSAKGTYKLLKSGLETNMGNFTVALLGADFCSNLQNLMLAAKIETIKISGVEGYDVLKSSEIENTCVNYVSNKRTNPRN